MALSGNKVELVALTAIPQGTAVVLKASAETYSFMPSTVEPEAIADNALKAVVADEGLVADGTQYVLNKVGDTVGFYKLKVGSKLEKGKGYLQAASSDAKEFLALEDITDGISFGATSKVAKTGVFNLNGQRLAAPAKGVNIVNGKKVIIK